jgi:hypothetical protein
MIRTGSERRVRRVAGAALLLALTSLAAPAAGAQGVRLELRPHVGDTVSLRMDQSVETVATQRVRGEDSTVSMQRAVTVFSRSVPLRVDREGTTVLAISDSMIVTDERGRTARLGLGGARASLHVAPDGATKVVDNAGMLSPDAAALVGQMPATLPDGPVQVGATWTHSTAVPLPGGSEAGAGRLRVTFRLDSLSRYGDVAFVSMQGTVARPRGGAGGGRTYESDGTVTGALEVDRRRGWLTSMRMTIVTKAALTRAPGEPPVHVRTKITQWMRVLVDKR